MKAQISDFFQIICRVTQSAHQTPHTVTNMDLSTIALLKQKVMLFPLFCSRQTQSSSVFFLNQRRDVSCWKSVILSEVSVVVVCCYALMQMSLWVSQAQVRFPSTALLLSSVVWTYQVYENCQIKMVPITNFDLLSICHLYRRNSDGVEFMFLESK